jgi:hypothetical protein
VRAKKNVACVCRGKRKFAGNEEIEVNIKKEEKRYAYIIMF